MHQCNFACKDIENTLQNIENDVAKFKSQCQFDSFESVWTSSQQRSRHRGCISKRWGIDCLPNSWRGQRSVGQFPWIWIQVKIHVKGKLATRSWLLFWALDLCGTFDVDATAHSWFCSYGFSSPTRISDLEIVAVLQSSGLHRVKVSLMIRFALFGFLLFFSVGITCALAEFGFLCLSPGAETQPKFS